MRVLTCCSRCELWLGYSRCFVHMVLYSPFIHYMANPPWEPRKANAYASGSKCVEAAVQAVRIAQGLDAQGMLNEAYALTVDVLALAATTLLAVELRAPEHIAAKVLRTSRHSKALMEGLAQHSNAAARCLESLMVRKSCSIEPKFGTIINSAMWQKKLTDIPYSPYIQLFPTLQPLWSPSANSNCKT
jgi:hypothetical protein